MTFSPDINSIPNAANLVLIGGGAYSTTSRPMLELGLDITGKQKPNVLIIPTSKNRIADYQALSVKGQAMYRDSIGTPVDILHKFGEMPGFAELEDKFNSADALYISGGNTRFAMEQWREHGVDELLSDAMRRGKVMTGISAGALTWFNDGLSDSMSYEVEKGEPWSYITVTGLGHINVAATPHFNSSDTPDSRLRSEHFKDYLAEKSKRTGVGEYGIGIDNNAALVATNGLVKIIRTDPNVNVHVATSADESSTSRILEAPAVTISKNNTSADQLPENGITWTDFYNQFKD